MKLDIWWTVLSTMWYMLTWTPIIIVFAKSWRRSIGNRFSLGIVGWKLCNMIILALLAKLLGQLLLLSFWCSLFYKLYIQCSQKNKFKIKTLRINNIIWIASCFIVLFIYFFIFFGEIFSFSCWFVIMINEVELAIIKYLFCYTLSFL